MNFGYSYQYIEKAPLSTQEGVLCANIRAFLKKYDLVPENDPDFTVCLYNNDDELVATGSLCNNVLKYIAVASSEQGSGACAGIVSELVSYAARQGIFRLFLFTKPANERLFSSLGFFALAKTECSVMMSNDRNGLTRFLEDVKNESPVVSENARVGAICANCNPMTLGHLYLFETAASMCDLLHVFILTEDRSAFSTEVRYDIVSQTVAQRGLPNLVLHKSSEYIISYTTFPTYFIKEQASAQKINADLDISLFGTRIAPYLNITKRFVGTEPYCAVTSAYNDRMRELLPQYGVELIEVERKDGISASFVRELIADRKFDELKKIVPDATYSYIIKHF